MASALSNIGLLFITVSVYQMLRGAVILWNALFGARSPWTRQHFGIDFLSVSNCLPQACSSLASCSTSSTTLASCSPSSVRMTPAERTHSSRCKSQQHVAKLGAAHTGTLPDLLWGRRRRRTCLTVLLLARAGIMVVGGANLLIEHDNDAGKQDDPNRDSVDATWVTAGMAMVVISQFIQAAGARDLAAASLPGPCTLTTCRQYRLEKGWCHVLAI